MRIKKIISLYEKDFYKWSIQQAALLKKKSFTQADMANIIEEISSLGKSDKRALKNQLVRLLEHLLKLKYFPEKLGNSNSWRASISGAHYCIRDLLQESPSLKRELKKLINEAYQNATELAAMECDVEINTFPKECPWTVDEVID